MAILTNTDAKYLAPGEAVKKNQYYARSEGSEESRDISLRSI